MKFQDNNQADHNNSWPFWAVTLCLFLIIVFGFLVRIEDMRAWQANPAKAFYEGEPLLTNIDGYYYLRIARDLAEDNYHAVDPLRITPDHPERAVLPPLLSVIAATVHKLTNISFNWIGVLLPPVLGVLLVFPLYGIGRSFGGPLMGLIASMTGILSNIYFARTAVGWFDTDCLNVTLTFTVAYFFLCFGIEKTSKRYWSLLAGILTWIVFLWWWDMAPYAVTIISLLPLGVALLFYYRPSRTLRNVFYVLVSLTLLILFFWQGIVLFKSFYYGAENLLHYVIGIEGGSFPNVSQLVGEQGSPKFLDVVVMITDSYPSLILGIIGLFLLFYQHPRKSLFLIAPILLSVLAIFFSKRFLIFFGPIVGLGFGYLALELWKIRFRFSIFRIAVPILVALIICINMLTDLATTQWVRFEPGLVGAFKYMENNTPEDSVIWAWWDWGHPMIYWSKRAAVTDGAAHGGELSVYNSIPYATSSPRLAANFIQFYVVHGLKGVHKVYEAVGNDPDRGLRLIKDVLSVGPGEAEQLLLKAQLLPVGSCTTVKDWLSFLFPQPGRKIYFSLDYRLGRISHWWYWLGTWDIAAHQGEHSRFMDFFHVSTDENGASDLERIFANFTTGEVLLPDDIKLLKSVSIFDTTGKKKEITFQHDAMAYMEIFKPGKYATLQRKDIRESMFNRLFLRHEKNHYFIPVKLETPLIQIYQVVGDTYGAALQ